LKNSGSGLNLEGNGTFTRHQHHNTMTQQKTFQTVKPKSTFKKNTQSMGSHQNPKNDSTGIL